MAQEGSSLALSYVVDASSAQYTLVDNANGGKYLVWSGTVTAASEAVPEPATATLSLLALAALAARRHRK